MPIPADILKKIKEDRIKCEREIDQLRWESARELAEDIILKMGWTKDDEDYEYQVKEETERLYEEERERDYWKRGYRYDEDFMKMLEEEEKKFSKEHAKKK